MRSIFHLLLAVPLLAGSGGLACAAQTWTLKLLPSDIVAGESLQKLRTRRQWNWKFDQDGKFEIAVRKKAFSVPAPQCHMDYLILSMPLYYPETPKQASVADRRAVYDALLAMQASGKGTLSAKVEALDYVQQRASGTELTSCNIYFVLPLTDTRPQ